VREVIVRTTTRGADILSDESKYRPTTKETADHSLPYCIAVAIAKGNVLPSDFEEEALKDVAVWKLLPKIKVVADPEIDSLFPKVKRAIVTIVTEDGSAHTRQEDFAKGRAERPLSDDELIDKFRANAEKTLSADQISQAIETVFHVEDVESIGNLMRALKQNDGVSR